MGRDGTLTAGGRTAITGAGTVSPLGFGVETLFAGLVAGNHGVVDGGEQWNGSIDGTYSRLAALVPGRLPEREIPRKQRRFMGRGGVLACLAAREALAQAGLEAEELSGVRTGIFVGTTLTGVEALEGFFRSYLVEGTVRPVPAAGFFRVMDHAYAANLATWLGVQAVVLATPGACAAGSLAIGLAHRWITEGRLDVALCGGVEECRPATSAIFDLLGAASSGAGLGAAGSPAPFDRRRDGTVPGEGAGILVLEREDLARRRGTRVLGWLRGFATLADGSEMAQPPARAMARCMRMALRDAKVDPADLGLVNAHATGTRVGDAGEAEALREVVGDRVAVNALKGYLGHTLGASGAIEAIAVLEMMRRGTLIPTLKLRDVDPACEGLRHQRDVAQVDCRLALKNSFGFGGINAVLVLERGDHE